MSHAKSLLYVGGAKNLIKPQSPQRTQRPKALPDLSVLSVLSVATFFQSTSWCALHIAIFGLAVFGRWLTGPLI